MLFCWNSLIMFYGNAFAVYAIYSLLPFQLYHRAMYVQLLNLHILSLSFRLLYSIFHAFLNKHCCLCSSSILSLSAHTYGVNYFWIFLFFHRNGVLLSFHYLRTYKLHSNTFRFSFMIFSQAQASANAYK